ncbi:MAG: glycosyltransferase family 39 protein [Anaerolineales bacterium]|jgi:hypothetical protein
MTLMSRRGWLLLSGSIVFVAVLARVVPGPRIIDDAFITYRYTRNLLLGRGLVFNPGERVLGTTTPLYALLLAVLSLPLGGASAPLPTLSPLLNALFDAGSCVLLLWLGKKLGSPIAGVVTAAIWAVTPMSVTFAIGGMETSLYVFLLLLSYLLYLNDQLVALGAVLGLAFLTRPDALLLAVPIVLDACRRAFSPSEDRSFRRRLPPAVAAGLAVVMPWSVFSFLYYGSVVPNSLLAKRVAYRLPPGAALVRLLQQLGTPFFEDLTLGTRWIGVGLILYTFVCLLALVRTAKRSPRAWPGLVFPWFYCAVFAAANPLIFRWYLTPPLPFYILSIVLGFRYLTADLGHLLQRLKVLERPPWLGRAGLTALALVPFALSLRAWDLRPPNGPSRPAPDMASIQLELVYAQAADYLLPQLRTGDQIAAGDVGVLGYRTDALILDTVGLNTPGAVKYYPLPASMYVINYAVAPDFILATRPRFVVILEVYGRNGLLQDPRFLQSYTLEHTLPTDMYGSRGMLVFERKVRP